MGLSKTTLSYAVTLALLGCFVLSADAIKCHQCNSHLDEDCNSLRLTVPRGVRDDQYLTDCEPRDSNIQVFCRKTVTMIAINGEQRIVRSCGWRDTELHGHNDSCISADNEGFDQEICACTSDGCNSAPISGRADFRVSLGTGVFMLLLAAVRRG